jgi:polyphosphate kinase 2
MSPSDITAADKALRERIDADAQDSLDEELEMELDETRLDQFMEGKAERHAHDTIDRDVYFKELFRLQGELVKLQDWVQHNKLKVAVIFEGRDSAGKGGVIKRITQRLNPRICRVAALPAPNERERTQWYFQRYVAHLPAGGEIVLFDRSWYNRAGVEKVMGFCTDEQYEEFFNSVPSFEHMLVRSGIILLKYWFSITDDEQQFRFLMRIHDPLNGRAVACALGAIHQGQGSHAGADAYAGSAVVGGRGRRQEEGTAQLHFALAEPGAVSGSSARARRAAGTDS